jgi:polyhydroxyalkanoate synthesis regulator phasin
MAAAAVAVLALGATGSVAANALIARSAEPARPAPVLMTAGVPAASGGVQTAKPAMAVAVTPADLAALEARVLDEVNHHARPTPVETNLTSKEYDSLVELIRNLSNTALATRGDTARLSTRMTELSMQVAQLAQNQQGGR